MPLIYYIVSGKVMEILQFILSFLIKEYGGEELNSVFDQLKSGNYDLKNFIGTLTPEKIAPIIKKFFGDGKNSPTENFSDGLSPIINIADRDIVYSLNGYLQEIN